MAENEAMSYLLTKFGEFVAYHGELILNSGSEVEQLEADLKSFNNFVKYASTRKIKDEEQRRLVREVCGAVYDAEDVVDAFVTHMSSSKSKSWWGNKFSRNIVTVDKIAQEVQKIRAKLEKFRGMIDDVRKNDIAENDVNTTQQNEVSMPRDTYVVGFKNDKKTIIEHLMKDTSHLGVVSITGMAGLGKSTLAWEVFRHPTIEEEYPAAKRLWIPVLKFPPKDVFLSILRKIASISEGTRNMREDELAGEVRRLLEKGKFLIVMDGVWSSEDWKNISMALPTNNNLGKILVTSRNADVALSASYQHDLQPLSLEDGIELLQREVFGEPRWESIFEKHGKKIAEKSRGLPLVIVVAGGIIKKKLHSYKDQRAKRSAWKDFSEKLDEYLHGDPEGTLEKVLSLSYDRLPYHLKACFLYFGMFPRDIEIPTWNLFQMWIAEGFVHKDPSFSLEKIAANNLEELISRNLVTPIKRNSDGVVKTCRVQESLHHFCKKQAGMENENFHEEIRVQEGKLEPEVTNNKYRRLYIHSDIISQFVASKPSGRGVRSIVCFSKKSETMKEKHASTIPGAFKSLRVLDVKSAIFDKVPTPMYELLSLRYVHLSLNSKVLPKDISRLWNIRTLIVETSQRTLEIKADIWKMRHLRHVKTNTITTLLESANATAQDEASTIETLGKISPESCTSNGLKAASTLRRVTIRGRLETLIERSLFDNGNVEKLLKLEKLKLENDTSLEGALSRLPPSSTFPPSLKILTLSKTFLAWSQMKVLGRLGNLEVLKLKEEAFTGTCWETAGDGFPSLEVLFIESSTLMEWKMSGDIFPEIMRLELRKCKELRQVPTEFAQKGNLSELILDNYRVDAVESANVIKRNKMTADPNAKFTLSIIPLKI